MLKAVGAVVVFVLIVGGASAAVTLMLSPKLRATLKKELELWKGDM